MVPMPRSVAIRRIVTASMPSVSATATAAAAIAARLCFGRGPRPPYSGISQIDAGTRARDPGREPDVVTVQLTPTPQLIYVRRTEYGTERNNVRRT